MAIWWDASQAVSVCHLQLVIRVTYMLPIWPNWSWILPIASGRLPFKDLDDFLLFPSYLNSAWPVSQLHPWEYHCLMWPIVLDTLISHMCLIHTYHSQPQQLAEVKAPNLNESTISDKHWASNPMSTSADTAVCTTGTFGSPMKLDITLHYMHMDFGSEKHKSTRIP